ncbi:MAG: hypothetical protein ACPGU1_21290 [Myxococcota bacterium]
MTFVFARARGWSDSEGRSVVVTDVEVGEGEMLVSGEVYADNSFEL